MTTALYAPIPPGPFDVVLVDPPWAYSGAQDKWAAAAKFYQTLDMDKLILLGGPLRAVLAKRAVVFMWTTGPKMAEAIHLLEQWGLHYRGVGFVWVKCRRDGMPMGASGVRPSITKPLTEFVLAASTVKTGRPLPLSDESVPQTVFAARGAHSEKPVEVHERIKRLYPHASKLELFARERRYGWTAWGDQL